jgi:hypothetical protein
MYFLLYNNIKKIKNLHRRTYTDIVCRSLGEGRVAQRPINDIFHSLLTSSLLLFLPWALRPEHCAPTASAFHRGSPQLLSYNHPEQIREHR